MRNAQREYFKTRDREVLRKSKALEKRVDAEIAQVKQKKSDASVPAAPSLFDNPADIMDIYINKRTDAYSGGLAIVAARSPQEAHDILMRADEFFEYYYDVNNWELLPSTHATGAKPRFIAEAGYTE